MAHILFICLFFAVPVSAGEADFSEKLEALLTSEFVLVLDKTSAGKEITDRIRGDAPKEKGFPSILLKREDSQRTAWFDYNEWTIYFNSKHAAGFFGIKGYSDDRITRVLALSSAVRKEFVDSADVLYVHELTHAAQFARYPYYMRDASLKNPIEFEYEAYFVGDIYFHEKMKRDPLLLKRFLEADYSDIYMEHALESYLSLSLDIDEYKKTIRQRYEDETGYITLEKAEAIQASRVEEGKILAYASGKMNGYHKKVKGLDEIRRQKKEFEEYLSNFYLRRWPGFSADALIQVGSTALEVENYMLALECLAVADSAGVNAGLDEKRMKRLRRKGAVAILQAAAFIRDRGGKMKIYELAGHIKALDIACEKTGRPFPEELKSLRTDTYPKAAEFYREKAGLEKNVRRARFYEENAKFFENR